MKQILTKNNLNLKLKSENMNKQTPTRKCCYKKNTKRKTHDSYLQKNQEPINPKPCGQDPESMIQKTVA